MVAVGNGASVGGGAELTPEADPEDGRLDVMISRAVGAARQRSCYAVRLGRGDAPPAEDVRRTCAAPRSRSPARRSGVSADGEIYGPERQRTWHVEPAAYSHGAAPQLARSRLRRLEPAAAHRLDAGLEAGVDARARSAGRRSGGVRCAG